MKLEIEPKPFLSNPSSVSRDLQDGPLQAYSKWVGDSSAFLTPQDTIRWHYNHLNLLVSRIYRRWNADQNKWRLESREIYQYDSVQRPTQLTHFMWDADQEIWAPSFRLVYSHWPDGMVQSETYIQWDDQLQAWQNIEKSSWFKDEQNRDTLILINRWDNASHSWTDFRMININWSPIALSGFGFPTYSLYRSFTILPSGEWSLAYLENNAFDQQGYILSSSVSTDHYHATETWTYNGFHQPVLILIDYDDPSNLASKDSIIRSFYGAGFREVDTLTSYSLYDTVWTKGYRELYLHPDSLESTSISYTGSTGNDWLPNLRKTIRLDSVFEQEVYVFDEKWDSSSQVWYPAFRTEKDYTLAGNLQQTRIFSNNDSVTNWQISSVQTYYYGLATSVSSLDQQMQLSLFPNPVKADYWISFLPQQSGEFTLSLISPTGQSIERQAFSVQGNQLFRTNLHAGHLPAGMYFLLLSDQNGRMISRPLLKK
ncbi:MAG: T9SS type A sorting domain-containing protein [Bacteroidota bacterium]